MRISGLLITIGFFAMLTVFYGQISTDLVKRKPPVLINNLEDLLETDRFPMVTPGEGIRSKLEYSEDKIWQAVYARRQNKTFLLNSGDPVGVLNLLRYSNGVTIIADHTHRLIRHLYCLYYDENDATNAKNFYHIGKKAYLGSLIAGIERIGMDSEISNRLYFAKTKLVEFGIWEKRMLSLPKFAIEATTAVDFCVQRRDYEGTGNSVVLPIQFSNVWRSVLMSLSAYSLISLVLIGELLVKRFLVREERKKRIWAENRALHLRKNLHKRRRLLLGNKNVAFND